MTAAITVALIVGSILYLCVVLAASIGFGRLTSLDMPEPDKKLPRVSVVVAARNEATRIRACVDAILANDYPGELLELIVVDDGSSDGTTDVLSDLANRGQGATPQLAVYRLDESTHGKGAALEAGVTAANGEIVMTTDADCLVPATWVTTMVAAFDDDVGFVAGPVANLDEEDLLSRIEAVEFLSLVGFGAGSIGLGLPTICNSANAAYRKSLFVDWCLGRQRSSVPASDELVMHYVHRDTRYRVAFCPSEQSLVETVGASSIRELLVQRSRWASSVPSFPRFVIAIGVVVYGFFASIVAGAIGALFDAWLLVPVLGSLGLKVVVDQILLSRVCNSFSRKHLMPYALAAELVHIPYVVAVSAVGIAAKPVWKGRSVARDTIADTPTLKHVYLHD
ncbi:MAG: glycosyltransferase [Rhodothermia bacterium]|nr:glycosyltransferase [Rhodothermia bacterium]